MVNIVGSSENPQVTPSGALNCARRNIRNHRGRRGRAAGRIPHRIGEGFEVVNRGAELVRIEVEAHNVPATGHRHPLCVHLAQVVAVRIRVGRQRAEHRGALTVDIGQGRHSP